MTRLTSGRRKYPVADASSAQKPEKRAGRRYGYVLSSSKESGRRRGTGFASIPPKRGLGLSATYPMADKWDLP
jgi:hypothetical protein